MSIDTAPLERRWTREPRESLQRHDARKGRVVRAKPGPWWDEPDKVQWVDRATGLDCLINRNQMGAWCGYVGLPPGHPWRGAGTYDQINATVHGGLTYGPRPCDEEAPEGHGICHVPFPGRPADVAWLGFDCGHAFDLSPVMATLYDDEELFPHPRASRAEWMREVYRDEAYVRREVEHLAAQAAEAATTRRRHGYVKHDRDERRRKTKEMVRLLNLPQRTETEAALLAMMMWPREAR